MDFWRGGSGCRVRSLGLVKALSNCTQLSVISNCPRVASDDALLKRLRLPFVHYWLDPNDELTHQQKVEKLAPLISKADVVIIRSVKNAYLLKAVSKNSHAFIDVDDLMSDYYHSKLQVGIDSDQTVCFEDENKIFSQFDRIMLIQDEHYNKFLHIYKEERLILVPPRINIRVQICRPIVSRVGLLASSWEANVDGLQWFLRDVWPRVSHLNITLDIYGLICNSMGSLCEKNVRVMGAVNDIDDFYSRIDIAINPVRYGSGIKIKSLEALAHGVPLLCTPEGARGLTNLRNHGLLIAETATDFALMLTQLMGDKVLRNRLRNFGMNYVRQHFGDNCFDALISAVNSCVPKEL